MFSLIPNYAQKLFCFPVIRLLVCLRAFSPCLRVEFWLLFWNVLFCQYYFILSQNLFSLPSASTFWFISSSCIVCSTCIVFFSFRPNIFQYFSSVLFVFVVVDFLSAFSIEFSIQVLSLCSCSLGEHRLYHRLISLLRLIVMFVEMYINNSFF